MMTRRKWKKKCAKESLELFEVTNDALKMNQLQYCGSCVKEYKTKKKVVYNKK